MSSGALLSDVEMVSLAKSARIPIEALRGSPPGQTLWSLAVVMANLRKIEETCIDQSGLDRHLRPIHSRPSVNFAENIGQLFDQNEWNRNRPWGIPLARACAESYGENLKVGAQWLASLPAKEKAKALREARAGFTRLQRAIPIDQALRALNAVEKKARQLA